jgi:DNA-directed RNA polymerase subunit RPC12/RpoP
MRRLLALVALGLTLSIGGNVMADQVADERVKAKNLIKCSTCGAEFTSAAGVEEHVRSHPGHKATLPKGTLIKCSTCGVEFTDRAGVVRRAKVLSTSFCCMKIWDPQGRIVCFTAAALLVPFMRKAS